MENVFCDRDGTIIYDRHYLSDPAGVELLPGAAAGLARLAAAGSRLFVVTNQSGIGRGLFGTGEYLACHRRLEELLAERGIALAGSAFCPHEPAEEKGCACRKPATGMWEALRAEYGLDPERSVMIGDKPEDIGFGKEAGFPLTILVLTGKGEKSAAAFGLPQLPPDATFLRLSGQAWVREDWPDCLARDLDGAADFLLTEKQACKK